MPTQYLSQRDPRWAGVYIANAPFTAGQKGCAFTSLIQLFQSLTGKTVTAKQYIELITDKSLFTDKNYKGGPGLILWVKVCAKLNKMFGTKFDYEADRAEFKNVRASQLAALKDPKRGCILNVSNGAHFATLWRQKKGDPKELIIADPWYGDLEETFKVYHNISGARYFKVA